VFVPEEDREVLVAFADEVEGMVEAPAKGDTGSGMDKVAGAVSVGVAHAADRGARLLVEDHEIALSSTTCMV
jgi:hypothetical protein